MLKNRKQKVESVKFHENITHSAIIKIKQKR